MKSVIHSGISLLLSEASLMWNLLKSNLDGAFVPFPIFTLASLLHRGALWDETIFRLICT